MENLTFDDACTRFISEDYIHIASGDWAVLFQSPEKDSVIRITPYDPAYKLFAETVLTSYHPNLPAISSITCMKKSAYAVEMPLYQTGPEELRVEFLNRVKAAMESGEGLNSNLSRLGTILRAGLEKGFKDIPYFAGMDWNPENVMFNGSVPVLIDAYYQKGEEITRLARNGDATLLSTEELESFFIIPFHRQMIFY